MWNEVLLCGMAVLAGMVNSVAGGGTLLTFPALLAVLGASPSAAVLANGTNTIVVWPASVVSTWEYRREYAQAARWFAWLLVPSLIGGLAGALLVVELPSQVFGGLVPWLILMAAILFAFQPQIGRWIGIGTAHERPTAARFVGILAFQFMVALYGGYFGAGIGILMLASLALMGLSDIHVMNGVKNLLATAINGMAAVVFIIYGRVDWQVAWPMMLSAIVGGFVGARVARRTNRTVVRRVIVAIGFALAAYYFYRQFRGAV
jgi:uncharacterized membrane protein YfcA